MLTTDCIHAFVRLRPDGGDKAVVLDSQTSVYLPKSKEHFKFEYAFAQTATNQEVYERTAAKLINEACLGFNSCVFSYGQTSSGKTFTMKGTNSNPGLIPLLLADAFKQASNNEWGWYMKIILSYMEIYNEQVNDLFNQKNTGLDIRENEAVGLTEFECSSFEQAMAKYQSGENIRKYAATGVNINSSRSHAVFRVTIYTAKKDNPHKPKIKACINLIDLAGSEGIDKTKAQGIVKKEGQSINKSLLTLSMVINSLGQKNGQFVSYRNSKLTRILEPSLTGGSRIMVICNINPTSNNLSQSVNTLKFGVSAGRVKLSIRSANDCSPNISTINDKADLSEDHELLNEELHRMSSKVEDLSSQLLLKQEQNNQLKESLTLKDNIIQSYEDEIRRLKDACATKDNKVELYQRSIVELRKTIEMSNDTTAMDKIKEQMDRMKTLNDKLMEDARVAKHKQSNMEKDINMYRSELKQLQRELAKVKKESVYRGPSLQIDNTNYEFDPVKLQNAVLLHAQLMEKNKEIYELNSTIQELGLYIEKLEKFKLENDLLKIQNQKENDQMNSNLSNLSRRPASETEQRKLRKNVGIYRHQLSEKRKRHEKCVGDLRKAHDKIVQLQKRLHEEVMKNETVVEDPKEDIKQ